MKSKFTTSCVLLYNMGIIAPFVRPCKFVALPGPVLVLDPFGVGNSTIWWELFKKSLIASVTVSFDYMRCAFQFRVVTVSSFHSICPFVCHLDNSHFIITQLSSWLSFAVCLTNLSTFTLHNPSIFYTIHELLCCI